MSVKFFSADKKVPTLARTQLKSSLKELFYKEGKVLGELNYIFCSDEYLLDINCRFLNHDYYTDIITFDISESPDQIKGEIYISIDRVVENAKELGQPVQRELLRVIFHGALHLCGYKDKTKAQKIQMRSKEDYYLDLF